MLRYLALTFPLAVALCLNSCARVPRGPHADLYDQIVIVGTNDFHGYLKPTEAEVQGARVIAGGAEWFAGYVRILEEKYGDRLVLLDAGDMFQGTLDSNYFLGKSTIDYYNLLPYRATVVGNHEFDYGPRDENDPDRLSALRDRIAQAKFPFLQANVFWKKSGKLWKEKNLFSSVMVNAGGYKIGIIGLTTTTTPSKTLPQNVTKLEFREFTEPARLEAAALRAKGAELVILAAHEGGEKEGGPLFTMLKNLPAGTIHAIVAGHDHTEVHEFVQGVPMIQSKTKGLFFGRIDLFVNKATRRLEPSLTKIYPLTSICGTWYKSVEGCDSRMKGENLLPLRRPTYEGVEVQPDLRVRAALAPYFAKTQKMLQEPLGQVKKDFEFFPSGESQMGFLFLRALETRFPYARVHYQNGGGLRGKILRGPLTYGGLYEVHPFNNYGVALKMSGRQLKDLVRVGISGANMMPAMLGVRATYRDDSSPAYLRDVNRDGKKEQWEQDRLVTLTWEKTGKPVRDNEEFWVSTNDYLASGGDNTHHIFDHIPLSRRRYLDTNVRDLVAEYLRKRPGISLPAEDEPRLQKAK